MAAMMMEVEDDDDVFFADLNKQISLLITDDNEDGDDVYYSPPAIISSCYPTSVSIQDYYYSRTSTFPTIHYQFDQMNYKNSTTTTDQSKGTGVFIPKSSSQWNRSRRSKHQQQPTKTSTNYNSYNNNTNNFRHYHHQQLPSQTVFSQVTFGSKK